MGTAFSRGDDAGLQTVRSPIGFAVETQAGELRHELHVETLEESADVMPETGGEDGTILRFDAPTAGKVVKVRVTGQAIVIVRPGGEVVVDSRGY
jgi:hypothetical protein